jgi:hypothetical protein
MFSENTWSVMSEPSKRDIARRNDRGYLAVYRQYRALGLDPETSRLRASQFPYLAPR